jgi:RNA polymerase sigma-70 factor, ECF subfamily
MASLLESYKDEKKALEHESDETILSTSVFKPSAFAILLERYQPAFLRKAQQVVGSRENAEDVVMETFTKIYRNAGKFETIEGASFKSWGYKILMNTSFTHYQRLKQRGVMLAPLTDEMIAVIEDKDAGGFEQFETSDFVQSVLGRMSAPFRAVLAKYFLEGKSQADIADEEGISVGAVKTRVHRAKEEFRRMATGKW